MSETLHIPHRRVEDAPAECRRRERERAEPVTRSRALDLRRFPPVLAFALAISGAHGGEPWRGNLGSLIPVMKSIHEERQFPMEFSRRGDLSVAEWQRRGRAETERTLSYHPAAVPLDMKVRSVTRMDGYEIRSITFATSRHYRVPAFLLVPTRGQTPFPAVVALHDHGGWFYHGKEKIVEVPGEHAALATVRARSYGGRGFANELAGRGYVVLAIDAFYWGERRLVHERPPPYLRELVGDLKPAQPEYVIATNTYLGGQIQTLNSWLSYVGASWLGIVNHDDRRSIDLLESVPEVDRQRIGCAGLSIGGYRSTYLVGTDPRIRAAVITGWMTSLPTTLDLKGASHSGIMDAFGLHAHLDHPDVATLGAPDAAIFVQNCRRDGLFTLAGMQLAVEKIERVYQALKRREFFRAELYDVPHSFDVKMQEDAFDWLDRHLRRAEKKS